ncbi:MAG TPA: hypothetical protein VMZ53_28845, partial [Kofleriaceae bacterium]|nr:hypothetical protein [Kofleriaceae bacterium]
MPALPEATDVAQAMQGTGDVAQAMHGTGDVARAIGGTGDVARAMHGPGDVPPAFAGCDLASAVVRRGPGRSDVQRVRGAGPLRVLCPRSAGNAAWLVTSSLGGGLVDGD